MNGRITTNPQEEYSDEDLVRRVQQAAQGDFRAYEALVERYQDRVQANCRYLSGSRTDAEDLTQEVFVKAFYGLRRFEGRASFHTWLRRIKANHCINFLKKKQGKTFLDLDAPAARESGELRTQPMAERNIAADAQRGLISETLNAIPDSLRVPLVLRDMDGLGYREIASELGLGLSAAKMRVKRGREMFRSVYSRLSGSGEEGR